MEVFVDNDSADDDDDVPVQEDYNEEELYGWLGPDADDEEGYEVCNFANSCATTSYGSGMTCTQYPQLLTD